MAYQLFNSRTLAGQSYSMNQAIAAAESPVMDFLIRFESRLIKVDKGGVKQGRVVFSVY